MKWTYIIDQKFKAAIAMLIVFLIVMATNLIDTQHFSTIQKSYTSVYEDRLLAENYLFQISRYLHERNLSLALEKHDAIMVSDTLDYFVNDVILKYELTKLTLEERQYFESLKIGLERLKTMENELKKTITSSEEYKLQIDFTDQIQMTWADLNGLSQIQLSESKKLVQDSDQIINTHNNITSQLEIAILIVLGLIILALIFSSKSTSSKFRQYSHLN